ncbi:MAG: flagellar biosynthetic protein FliQ [Nitrospirae bacterium]|nr:MAG: flagellar biosynthetic protein FliQ [Nitrospirota bacterium]
MTVEMVKDISLEVVKTICLVAGPPLLISLFVGLIISFFQAITQIQEFTLTFVPKMVAVLISILLLLPWTTKVLIHFTKTIIEKIPLYIK